MSANKEKPKAANGAGNIERRGDKYFARIIVDDGKGGRVRKRIPIPPMKETDASRRDFLQSLIEKARSGTVTFDPPKPRGKAAKGPATTVRELARAWTNGTLLKEHGKVNGLRALASDAINWCTIQKHALNVQTRGDRGPMFGDLRIVDVGEDDIGVLIAKHAEGRHGTRQKTYRRLHRLFDLAEFPCKVRPEGSNPVTRRLRPVDDDQELLFSYLYPSELLQLLRCPEVGEARRLLYALAAYTGLRKGSLLHLVWGNIDFRNGTIRVMRTKTKAKAFFAGDPSLMFLLRLWHLRCGRPGPAEPVVRDIGVDPHVLARTLRDDLLLAGVDRTELHAEEDGVQRLRFHDLRASFVTWAKRDNRTDAWIAERTGHQSDEMMERYTRAARTLADLRMVAFPDISNAVPELVPLAHRLAQSGESNDAADSASPPKTQPSPATTMVGASGFEPPTPRPPV